jgi:hypothetical protein
VQLLFPDKVSRSVDEIRNEMNALFTATTDRAHEGEKQLGAAVERFVDSARATMKSP